MRDKQREETRRRVYLAALEVFRRDGVAGCRIDDIAQKAEVSRSAFYFHYPTKDDVLIELLRESERPVGKAVEELPLDTPFEKVLSTVAAAMADFWKDEPKLLIDVATVALRLNSVVMDREAEPVRGIVAERFRLAAARNELSPVLPAEVLSDFFLFNSLAAMVAWSASPGLDLEVALQGVAMLFLTGAAGPKLKART